MEFKLSDDNGCSSEFDLKSTKEIIASFEMESNQEDLKYKNIFSAQTVLTESENTG